MKRIDGTDAKINCYKGISCFKEESEEWLKYLVPPGQSFSCAVRQLLNAAVAAKRAEQNKGKK